MPPKRRGRIYRDAREREKAIRARVAGPAVSQAPLKIRPFVSAGEVLVRPDGSGYDIVPISAFRLKDGGTVIRIGRTALFFDADGTYDGAEGRMPMDAADGAKVGQDYLACAKNVGQRPAEPYFDPERDQHEAETAIWPPLPSSETN